MRTSTICALTPLLAQAAFGATIHSRANDSLYDPESGHPQAQDLVDFVKNGSGDWFDTTFAIVMYAFASQPDHVDKLFHDNGDGTHSFTFYDPVTHDPTRHPVSFADAVDFRQGKDLEAFKNRWWVAAAFKVLKGEWYASYESKDDANGRDSLSPTDKGEAFDDAIQARHPGFVGAPLPLGDIDFKAALWLMNVLTRRNVVWSTYRNETDSSYAVTSDTIKDVANHPPTLWVGFAKSDDTDTINNYKAYAMTIEYRERSDVFLSRPDAGSTTSTTLDLEADESSFGAILIRLENLSEEWNKDKWYEVDPPHLTEPLKPL